MIQATVILMDSETNQGENRNHFQSEVRRVKCVKSRNLKQSSSDDEYQMSLSSPYAQAYHPGNHQNAGFLQ
jgi:hypothetical protein